jgi:hypothetical protein
MPKWGSSQPPPSGWLGGDSTSVTGGSGSTAGRGGAAASNITLEVDFVDGNIVPETGPAGTFTRASSRTYADGTAATDLTLATSGNPAVEGFFYNPSGGTVGGVHIAGAAKNWALHSEDLSNAAWVATNVTKSTSSMVQPDGDTASTDVATATANNG